MLPIFLMMLGQAAAAAPQPMPAFLSGCWEETKPSGDWTEECWTDTRGGVMVGSGRSGMGERVGHWEWMRIERDAGGQLLFFGSPGGARPVAFRAEEADGDSVTFINFGHDYPQRIRYSQSEAGLDAETALEDGSKANRWHYRRTAGASNSGDH